MRRKELGVSAIVVDTGEPLEKEIAFLYIEKNSPSKSMNQTLSHVKIEKSYGNILRKSSKKEAVNC
jgi:hypothetical protein